MEDRREAIIGNDEINQGEYFAILRPHWWKIFFLSFFVGVVTLIWMFRMPNLYRASATITPAVEERKQNLTLGALASFGAVGGPSKVEELEALFKSNDLTARVFHKYNLWPVIMPDRFDPKTGELKTGWIRRLLGEEGAKPPGDWDAIRIAQDRLIVSINRRNGTLSISFDSLSPEGSADIVRYYLDEMKNRLQEEAFERANNHKKFIEEQISRTIDTLTRDRLYSLYGQEVEREMMARNREHFGFRVIDSARVPDRKAKPQRAKAAVLATILAAPAWAILLGYLGRRREARPGMSDRERSAG